MGNPDIVTTPMRHWSFLSCEGAIKLARSVLYLADETSISTTNTANTDKCERLAQRLKVKIDFSVPFEMYPRVNGSLAMAADPFETNL